MKTRKIITLALMASLTVLFSCKSNTSTTANEGENATGTTETSAVKTKYGMKSGIVVYSTQMMGMDVKQTMYFEEGGAREAQEVSMEMMGIKMHTLTITKDGIVYTLDMEKKTGTKAPVVEGSAQNIDFQNLSEELAKDMELKKLGTEDFLGKTCDKMSIDYKKMAMKGTFLVYKGVALKSETEFAGMKVNLIAEKFEENAAIPAGKFDVPADFTITELK
jgi:hypothetical protein